MGELIKVDFRKAKIEGPNPKLKDILPSFRHRLAAWGLLQIASVKDAYGVHVDPFIPLSDRQGEASTRARNFIVKHADPATAEAQQLLEIFESRERGA